MVDASCVILDCLFIGELAIDERLEHVFLDRLLLHGVLLVHVVGLVASLTQSFPEEWHSFFHLVHVLMLHLGGIFMGKALGEVSC